jgi:hypothetical protein
MRLVAPADRGVWFTFTEDRNTGEKVEFEVRRIPAAVAKEIENDVLGWKRQTKVKKGVQLIDYTVEESEEMTYRKAVYALRNSRGGAELPAVDVPALAAIDGASEFVTLDGRLTDEVKRQVFEAFPNIALWVVEKANTLDAQAQEEEEGKGKAS